jgi:hypothetical protein
MKHLDVAPSEAVTPGELEGRHFRPAWVALWLILGIHAALLLPTLSDYRVSIDAGYHVSLARWYAEHGTAFWDHINFGPQGRPNLQGPALHVSIALLGRVLGGTGDDYVNAHAILAILQWAAAMWTVVYFARRFGGEWAALFAVALAAGNAVSEVNFAIGLPSGWLFILSGWAVLFFLEDRLWPASLAASLAIYVHLAGYGMAPVGILVAAALTGRWRKLLRVGAITAIATAPYTIHILRNLAWYQGQRGHSELRLAPLIYLAAAPGIVWLLRKPKDNVLLLAWFAATLSWALQNYTRFLAQATLPMSVIGGIWVAKMISERKAAKLRYALMGLFLAGTTLPWTLNSSSLIPEFAWLTGIRYPRLIDWSEARAVSGVIQRAGLGHRLIAPYNPSKGVSLAVWAPLQIEKGHWVEVQPRHDPAEELSAGGKVYVLPISPSDTTLVDLQHRGFLTIHGGSAISSVVTLNPASSLARTVPVVAAIISTEAAWLSVNARNNVRASFNLIGSPSALAEWRQALLTQRERAGRLEVAAALYAYALESVSPEVARSARGVVRGFGSMAFFLGDETCIGFVSESRHARMRQNMADVAAAANRLTLDLPSAKLLGKALGKLFGEYFTEA